MIHLLGYASGLGGVNPECGQGPIQLRKSFDINQYASLGVHFHWDAMISPSLQRGSNKAEEIHQICLSMASRTAELIRQQAFFIVIGGDHTSAIGTWSGVYEGMHQRGPLGLIWVDAHMDSHVPKTSLSGRIHGMPLAALLGFGSPLFTQILSPMPKIKPQHLCLIGVRSYEKEEEELLKQLKVRVYLMEEVKKRGLAAVFQEALAIVKRGTANFGISVDVDSLDPQDAPGVDVLEPGGLKREDLCAALSLAAQDPRLVGAEIAEFNPAKDVQHITEKTIFQLIAAIGSRYA